MAREVEFSELVGEHQLTGVDFETVRNEGDREDANACRFVLDGRIYVAVEDPEDGYRSCMRSLQEVDGPPVANTFEPVRVVGRHRASCGYGSADVLEFLDCANGEVILEVGTDNNDDYYPSFVGNFMPERMAVNQAKG